MYQVINNAYKYVKIDKVHLYKTQFYDNPLQ